MRSVLRISLISIFFLGIYFYLFYSGFIHYLALGTDSYFNDYKVFTNGLNCLNKGLSPYEGPIELNCRNYNYGHAILILTPFKDFLVSTNQFTLPIILAILFIISSIKILSPNNYFKFFVCLLALLNPSTLLLIERMNLDILLYLIVIFLALNKFYFLNWLLVIYAFLFKFHPFIYGIIIFVEKKGRDLKDLFFIFLFILITSLIFIFLFKEEHLLMLERSGSWKMGLHYLFSIKSIPKVLKEAFSFHYGLMLLIIYIIFFYQVIKKSKTIDLNEDDFSFEKKLFLISSNSILFCFIVFSNAFYREVFLILTIPYLIMNSKIFKSIILFMCFKFIFNFIYTLDLNFETFNYIDGIRVYKNHFLSIVFFKGIIDYILMMFIGAITLKMNLNLFNSYKKMKSR